MAHNHWIGQVDDPEEGVRQLRTVGLTIYLLALIPVFLCFVMTAIGGVLWPLILAWSVLTSFLVLAGLGENEAFAAAVVFRIATFYIPAGEGFFATKWLEDGD